MLSYAVAVAYLRLRNSIPGSHRCRGKIPCFCTSLADTENLSNHLYLIDNKHLIIHFRTWYGSCTRRACDRANRFQGAATSLDSEGRGFRGELPRLSDLHPRRDLWIKELDATEQLVF